MFKWLMVISFVTVAMGCGRMEVEPRVDGEPFTVVTTTGMIADLVRKVAGDAASVKALIGEGVDPHLYNPTRSDVAALMAADIIFYNGLMLEGRMNDVLERLARRGRPVWAVTRLVDSSFLLEDEEEGQSDPHLWMDVTAWMKALEAITEALIDFDPSHEEVFRARSAAFRSQLETLDAYARERVATIPERNRVLITAHDAFAYFGRAYGIEVLGVQGLSTESEAGLHDINRLVDLIVERSVPAVFAESSVADRSIRALIDGARARGHEVNLGGVLFSDAMGAPGTYEGTYIGMIDHNVTTIVRALGGEAPDRGMQGKLTVRP